jgi:hypothetical protein
MRRTLKRTRRRALPRGAATAGALYLMPATMVDPLTSMKIGLA